MSSPRGRRYAGLALLLSLVAAVAAAEEAKRIGLRLMVSHASARPGPVDPAGRDLHERLKREFTFRSLRVIESRRITIHVDEVQGLRLPTGRWVRVRPLYLGQGVVLLAVDVEGKIQTDLRVRNHQPVSIGIERYQDGKLIVTLQPDF